MRAFILVPLPPLSLSFLGCVGGSSGAVLIKVGGVGREGTPNVWQCTAAEDGSDLLSPPQDQPQPACWPLELLQLPLSREGGWEVIRSWGCTIRGGGTGDGQ